jgi:hypothetical protein
VASDDERERGVVVRAHAGHQVIVGRRRGHPGLP